MEHVIERRGLGPFLVAPIGFGAMRLTGANVFGRTCLAMIRASPQPTQRAASTNACSRSESVEARTRRTNAAWSTSVN